MDGTLANQIQADWNQTSDSAADYIKNKPTIPAEVTETTVTNWGFTKNTGTSTFSGSYNDLTDKPTIPPSMVVLEYGTSTWNQFYTAYQANAIVYCKASSNSNPGTGDKTRMAFMAYVNSAVTEVEFQYYRSVSSHSDSQQGDEVYVYKLTSSNGGTWSVTKR